MSNNLKKGIASILLANIINLAFNLIINFLLPKYLSINSYSSIKTFQLYSTYVGIFALGYSDGMYLKYGGKAFENLDRGELKGAVFVLRNLMIIETIILLPIVYTIGDNVLFFFVLTIMSANMISFFKSMYQAVGEFEKYGALLNCYTVITFFLNIALLFIFGVDDYRFYLVGYVVVDVIIWIALELSLKNTMQGVKQKEGNINTLLGYVKSGFLLMVGNFSNILLSSMDRWFVKAMMDSAQFAYYSFAVSMEGFLNVAITPITTTLYNHFCNHQSFEDVNKVRKFVMIFSVVIVAALFPAKFIIELFLHNYIDSINVLVILFASQIFYTVIKGIYVNLYKAQKRQNTYFIKLASVLVIGATLNYFLIKIYPYKEAFSYGTLLSAIIWFGLCIIDFKMYPLKEFESVFLIAECIVFILTGFYMNSILGLVIYMVFTYLMISIFMKNELKCLINEVRRVIAQTMHQR